MEATRRETSAWERAGGGGADVFGPRPARARRRGSRPWLVLWAGPLILHTSLALQIMYPVAALHERRVGRAPHSALRALPPLRRLRGGTPRVNPAAPRRESTGAGGPAGGAGAGSSGFAWKWRKREIGNILRFSLPALSIPLAVGGAASALRHCVRRHARCSSPPALPRVRPLLSLPPPQRAPSAQHGPLSTEFAPSPLAHPPTCPLTRSPARSQDPIMSLVDSICVGQYASTLELAALGPNLVIFNFVTFSFSFLAIGTTLRVSAALAANNAKKASDTISTALLISTVSGAALVAFMVAFGAPTLAATGAVPELLAAAGGYLAVRIWACPAVLATTVLQSGLLAQRDSVTCLLAVIISAAVNVVGDIWLICHMKMGLVGAAWATAVGNYVSLAVLLVLGYTSWGESLRDAWSGRGGGRRVGRPGCVSSGTGRRGRKWRPSTRRWVRSSSFRCARTSAT